jgi:Kef-type K+ transport system membrane component KefB
MIIFTGDSYTLFGFTFHTPTLNYLSVEFDFLAEIGILFLMFISGLSTNLGQLKSMGKAASCVAIGGVVIPLMLGVLCSLLFGLQQQDSIIMGLVLVATSVGVTVRTLMDMDMLDSRAGITILGGAVIDDVLGIMLLAFVVGTDSMLAISVKITLFFVIFLYFALKIIDSVLGLGEKISLPKAFLSISLSIFLLYSFFADRFGISGIIGAFIAGLLIGHSIKSRKIIDDVQSLGYGFFVPLFFVWIGTQLFLGFKNDATLLTTIWFYAVSIIFIGIIGKIIGCSIGAKAAGMSKNESLQVGIGMIPRMELALIIISTAISKKLISSELIAHQLLAVTVILTIATTLVTPFLIKLVFKNN